MCGSCWAFNTTSAVEGAHFLATAKLLSLNEQQLVDCDHQSDLEEVDACDGGCGGSLMTNAYKYVEEAGGLELEADYPYTDSDGKCKFNADKVAAKVSNFTNIPLDEDQVAAYIPGSALLPLVSMLSSCKPIWLECHAQLFATRGDLIMVFSLWVMVIVVLLLYDSPTSHTGLSRTHADQCGERRAFTRFAVGMENVVSTPWFQQLPPKLMPKLMLSLLRTSSF